MPLSEDVCKPKCMSVIINGVDLNIIEIETHIQKDGIADLNYFTNVKFSSVWKDTNYIEQLSELNSEDHSSYDLAKVYCRSQDTNHLDQGNWQLVHHGYVSSIGNTPREEILDMDIKGAETFLTSIPASKNFETKTTTQKVLNYFKKEFLKNTPFNNLSIKSSVSTEIYHAEGVNLSSINPSMDMTFQANRNTLYDVINRLAQTTNSQWFFKPKENGLDLVFGDIQPQTYTGIHNKDVSQGKNVEFIEDNGLYEISPINMVRVTGSTAYSFAGIEIPHITSNSYPYAEAKYPPLINPNTEVKGIIEETNDTTEDNAEKTAKKLLKQKMTESVGDQKLFGTPTIIPYDKTISEPVPDCHNTEINPPPIEYQVTSVKHHQKGGEMYKTDLNVGLWVDEDKITATSDMKEQ